MLLLLLLLLLLLCRCLSTTCYCTAVHIDSTRQSCSNSHVEDVLKSGFIHPEGLQPLHVDPVVQAPVFIQLPPAVVPHTIRIPAAPGLVFPKPLGNLINSLPDRDLLLQKVRCWRGLGSFLFRASQPATPSMGMDRPPTPLDELLNRLCSE
jgi:hypothetical protein